MRVEAAHTAHAEIQPPTEPSIAGGILVDHVDHFIDHRQLQPYMTTTPEGTLTSEEVCLLNRRTGEAYELARTKDEDGRTIGAIVEARMTQADGRQTQQVYSCSSADMEGGDGVAYCETFDSNYRSTLSKEASAFEILCIMDFIRKGLADERLLPMSQDAMRAFLHDMLACTTKAKAAEIRAAAVNRAELEIIGRMTSSFLRELYPNIANDILKNRGPEWARKYMANPEPPYIKIAY